MSLRPLDSLLAAIESGARPAGGVSARTGQIPSVGGENITLDGRLRVDDVRRIPESFYRLMRQGRLKQHDVLINKDGAQTGKVAIYRGEFADAAINEHVFLLRSKPAELNQRFLFHLLRTSAAQRQISKMVRGSAQPGLQRGFTAAVGVPALTPAQQEQVADQLDEFDELVACRHREIAKVEAIREGVLSDLFAADGSVATDDLQTLCSAPICYGILQPGRHTLDGIPIVAINNMLGDLREDLHRCAPQIDSAYARSRIRGGDVLISVKGTIGRVRVLPPWFDGNIGRDIARLRPGPRIRADYLAWWLKSPAVRHHLDWLTVGTTRAELSIGTLRKVRVPVPEPDEQERAVVAAESVQAVIDEFRREVAKLELVRDGARSELVFAGAVDETA